MADDEKTSTGMVRLSVNLNKETADALKEIADRQNISVTEAVRRAISIFRFIESEREEGRKIQAVDAHEKNKRELVFM